MYGVTSVDLIRRPIVRYIHGGRYLTKSARKGRTVTNFPERPSMQRHRKWQTLYRSVPRCARIGPFPRPFIPARAAVSAAAGTVHGAKAPAHHSLTQRSRHSRAEQRQLQSRGGRGHPRGPAGLHGLPEPQCRLAERGRHRWDHQHTHSRIHRPDGAGRHLRGDGQLQGLSCVDQCLFRSHFGSVSLIAYLGIRPGVISFPARFRN